MRIIVAEMKAAPGKRAQLLAILDSMLAPSRAEPGCVSYRYFLSSEDPDLVHFFEEWTDQEAVEAHFATDHFQALGPQLVDLVEGAPDIRIYEAAPADAL